ncbi:amidohydrolase family protein [Candidatus Electrothrix sp.]|uniref:amidohydrolase family protein n=1 Tax=Candidatus Electrothrix sp. TaxID=2170559 RepID=UPI00405648A5
MRHTTKYIRVGRIIDGSGGTVRRNILLKIKDGHLQAFQPAGSLRTLPHDTLFEDLTHCTLVPALVDCSVSLLESPAMNLLSRPLSLPEGKGKAVEEQSQKKILERHLSYCFAHGILGLVVTDKNQFVQAAQRKEEYRADGITRRTAHDAPDADFLRIQYSPDIEEEAEDLPLLNYEDLSHILNNRGDKKAIVVANGPQQVTEAIEAGCDAIEQGYGMGPDNLQKMADKGLLWIPSVVRAKNALDGSSSGGSVCCRFSTRYVAPGEPVPGAEAFWKKIVAEQLGQLALARKSGIMVAVGTGAGSRGILHGESLVEEIKLFIKAGYSLEESIRCASKNGAEFFAMEQLGQLAVGKKANFLLTRGTVGQLPRKLGYLEGVYIDGQSSPEYRK